MANCVSVMAARMLRLYKFTISCRYQQAWTTSRMRTKKEVATHLVVIREGNDGSAHTQDHGGVDLAVGVRRAVGALFLGEVIRGHRQHDRLLLQGVDVLNDPARHKVLPAGGAEG